MDRENNELLQGTNRNYVNQTALQYRLNTEPLLQQIEFFLSGKRVVLEEINGELKEKKMQIGYSRMNDKGVQNVVNYVTSIINPAVVQGNLGNEQYENIVYRCI